MGAAQCATSTCARVGGRENYSSPKFTRRLPWGCGGGAPWATEVAALVAAVRCAGPLIGRGGGSPLRRAVAATAGVVGFVWLGVAFVSALGVLRSFLDSPLRAEWEMYSGESSMWRLVRIILQKYLMVVRDMQVASAFAFLVFMPSATRFFMVYCGMRHL